MSAFDTRPEKATAAEQVIDQPTYIGTDKCGAVHYWSVYDRTVVVVEEGQTATCELSGYARPLKHWRSYTTSERGWRDCQITSQSLLGGL